MLRESIDGVQELTLERFVDHRGYFCETYNANTLQASGVAASFVQDNESLSVDAGTIRGIHYQTGASAQGKLVRVTRGAVFDVVVDLRTSSDTFGDHMIVELSEESRSQLWVPPWFGHGFCTLVPDTLLSYKVTDFYCSKSDRSLRYDDPQLGISWPVEPEKAILSDKDLDAPTLGELRAAGDLFQ